MLNNNNEIGFKFFNFYYSIGIPIGLFFEIGKIGSIINLVKDGFVNLYSAFTILLLFMIIAPFIIKINILVLYHKNKKLPYFPIKMYNLTILVFILLFCNMVGSFALQYGVELLLHDNSVIKGVVIYALIVGTIIGIMCSYFNKRRFMFK